MNRIKHIILTLGIIAGFGLSALPVTVGAANAFSSCDGSDSVLCQKQKTDSLPTFIKTIVNTLLYVLGAVSVIMIIIGGIRYTTSMGEAKDIEGAKNTVMYAVVGLVVALLAYAIVNFVVVKLFK